ncbi:MAG TPA: nicotinamide riboside transporter PnuC [Armatimonadota bacterium]|nr:nicotinamide riboside transporter PnuC [Armatimonadota bacterium]
MNDLLRALTSQMSAVEVVASVATLVNVYLILKNNTWCWIWGIVAVVLYGWVFYTGRLYSSMALQILYYLPMQFFGWWVWLRSGPRGQDDLPITRLSWPARIGWLALIVPVALLLGYLSARLGAALSYADAAATAMSIVGQYLLTRKRVENWVFWIAVDVLYAFYLLPQQGLWISAALYVILLGMAVAGLAEWLRIMRAEGVRTAEQGGAA